MDKYAKLIGEEQPKYYKSNYAPLVPKKQFPKPRLLNTIMHNPELSAALFPLTICAAIIEWCSYDIQD